jgi:hypothetical protein
MIEMPHDFFFGALIAFVISCLPTVSRPDSPAPERHRCRDFPDAT